MVEITQVTPPGADKFNAGFAALEQKVTQVRNREGAQANEPQPDVLKLSDPKQEAVDSIRKALDEGGPGYHRHVQVLAEDSNTDAMKKAEIDKDKVESKMAKKGVTAREIPTTNNPNEVFTPTTDKGEQILWIDRGKDITTDARYKQAKSELMRSYLTSRGVQGAENMNDDQTRQAYWSDMDTYPQTIAKEQAMFGSDAVLRRMREQHPQVMDRYDQDLKNKQAEMISQAGATPLSTELTALAAAEGAPTDPESISQIGDNSLVERMNKRKEQAIVLAHGSALAELQKDNPTMKIGTNGLPENPTQLSSYLEVYARESERTNREVVRALVIEDMVTQGETPPDPVQDPTAFDKWTKSVEDKMKLYEDAKKAIPTKDELASDKPTEESISEESGREATDKKSYGLRQALILAYQYLVGNDEKKKEIEEKVKTICENQPDFKNTFYIAKMAIAGAGMVALGVVTSTLAEAKKSGN